MLRHVALVRNYILEGTYHLHHQGDKNRRARSNVRVHMFLAYQFLSPWSWRWYNPLKCRFLRGPRGVISQKMAHFISLSCHLLNYESFPAQRTSLWLIFCILSVIHASKTILLPLLTLFSQITLCEILFLLLFKQQNMSNIQSSRTYMPNPLRTPRGPAQ
jgi:hypothetical protein